MIQWWTGRRRTVRLMPPAGRSAVWLSSAPSWRSGSSGSSRYRHPGGGRPILLRRQRPGQTTSGPFRRDVFGAITFLTVGCACRSIWPAFPLFRADPREKPAGLSRNEDKSLKHCCFYKKAAPPRGQIAGHRLLIPHPRVRSLGYLGNGLKPRYPPAHTPDRCSPGRRRGTGGTWPGPNAD